MARRVRVGKTIDPELVTDIDSWCRYYESKYTNIIYDKGSMLVLDPTVMASDPKEARANPAKTIVALKGVDYNDVLGSSSVSEELRAAADAKRKAIHDVQTESVTTAATTLMDAEQDLLVAVDAWRVAEDDSSRTASAIEVGRLTKEVEVAERSLRSATYPHRYVKEEVVEMKNIDYATHDDRKRGLYRLVNAGISAPERTVIVADKA